jgi:peroxiredoxin
MPFQKKHLLVIAAAASVLSVARQTSGAAPPTVEDALKLSPLHTGVEYDRPTADEAKACKITGGARGWTVLGGDGAVLRQFADSNADGVVDTWSYYRGGLEVYRDIDANYNGKADQYRWFHTAGSRWGLDRNEDGTIDAWKFLTAEEASEEAVNALRTKDTARFARLLLAKEDIAKLGLSKTLAQELEKRLQAAPKTFAALASAGKFNAAAEFTDFGGQRPGAVPAGTRGSTKDLLVYEDVWCMVRLGEEHQQLQLGSMVAVDGVWKLIDGPSLGAGDAALAGFFYNAAGPNVQPGGIPFSQPTEEMQKILEAIQKIDEQLAAAADEKKAALHAQRADQLERLAAIASGPADRDQWIKQLADMISSAVQDGSYPDGLARLAKLEEKLKADKTSEELRAHVEFRRMQAAYGLSWTDPKADYAKVQEAWLKQLEDFVGSHQGGEHVAEALYQLAMAYDFPPANATAAQKWYQRLVAEFPNDPLAIKARGALRRLTSVGKTIPLKGPALQGGTVDLAQYRGRVVLVHYWSTETPSCQADHEELLDLYAKYGGRKFDVIGVNLDAKREAAAEYLKKTRLPWKQLYEPGGLFDSRLATEMGIIQLPQMILVDAKGQVVSANILTAELAAELKKLIPSEVAAK